MRLRRKPWIGAAIRAYDAFVYGKANPADASFAGRWPDVFGRPAPLFVELGCGKGRFISTIAQQQPECNFIGIEREQDVLYPAAVKVSDSGATNVRLLVCDVQRLAEIFAPHEIDGLYLNFCDPWPKRRQAHRRLTGRAFLATYRQLLKPRGLLTFKTDNRDLFDWSLKEFAALGLNVSRLTCDLHGEGDAGNIETEYERKFSALGNKICRCVVEFGDDHD